MLLARLLVPRQKSFRRDLRLLFGQPLEINGFISGPPEKIHFRCSGEYRTHDMTNGAVDFPGEPFRIEKATEGIHRPLWSVMIPAYNCAQYLRQTLESVLVQDPGPEQMQIEVVDDCSTLDDPEAVVREAGKGRVAFYRRPQNGGVTANFNTCLQRSCGHLVHILHGDDYVLPGFYAKIADQARKHPNVSSFFARCQIVEEDGTLDCISSPNRHLFQPSHLPGNLLYSNDLRTPGVVIRRSFYETHGGFLPGLVHVADWEMWVRAISRGGGLFLNELLAAYRYFPTNETGRLARTAENLRSHMRLAGIFASQFHDFDPARFRKSVAQLALQQERRFTEIGDKVAASSNHQLWRELTPWILRWEPQLRRLLSSLRHSMVGHSL
jgi:GT2 family glycosyltransferase